MSYPHFIFVLLPLNIIYRPSVFPAVQSSFLPSNKAAVPEAKGALDKFKYEVATELGVPLTDGYNGDLTSRQNGSVGGYMVKKMIELLLC